MDSLSHLQSGELCRECCLKCISIADCTRIFGDRFLSASPDRFREMKNLADRVREQIMELAVSGRPEPSLIAGIRRDLADLSRSYEDFAAENGLHFWKKNDARRMAFQRIASIREPYETYEPHAQADPPENATNLMLILVCHVRELLTKLQTQDNTGPTGRESAFHESAAFYRTTPDSKEIILQELRELYRDVQALPSPAPKEVVLKRITTIAELVKEKKEWH